MTTTLHILVVDDRPDSVLFLTEFLLARRHRVETCGNGAEALEAIVRRHRTADAYELLISDVSMPGMDGITLLKEIRRRQMLLPVALYTAYGSMHPTLAQQAQQYACMAVLDKPLELRRIEGLVDDVIARRSGTARQDKDQPFFGTSRVAKTTSVVRRETSQPGELPGATSGGYALEPKNAPPRHSAPIDLPNPPAPTLPPPIRTPLPFPAPTAEPPTRSMPSFRTPPVPQQPERQSTGRSVNPAFRTPLPFLQQGNQAASPPVIPPTVASAPPMRAPPTNPGEAPPGHQSTSFLRRGVTPPTKEKTGYVRRPSGFFLSSPGTADSPPPAGGTARIRRTVTGSYVPSQPGGGSAPPSPPPPASPPPPTAAGSSRAVACAYCRKVFMVGIKPASYTAVCIHCGQLNRIDPL
jgi:CheY-like chemotaxis protein